MIPIDKEQVRLLEQRLRGIGVDRRTFLKIAGAAMAAPAAGSLLAACGGDDDDDADPTNTIGGRSSNQHRGSQPEPSQRQLRPRQKTRRRRRHRRRSRADRDLTAAAEATAAPAMEMDADQTLHTIGVRAEPASHDFNADLYCGGVAQIWMGLLQPTM